MNTPITDTQVCVPANNSHSNTRFVKGIICSHIRREQARCGTWAVVVIFVFCFHRRQKSSEGIYREQNSEETKRASACSPGRRRFLMRTVTLLGRLICLRHINRLMNQWCLCLYILFSISYHINHHKIPLASSFMLIKHCDEQTSTFIKVRIWLMWQLMLTEFLINWSTNQSLIKILHILTEH